MLCLSLLFCSCMIVIMIYNKPFSMSPQFETSSSIYKLHSVILVKDCYYYYFLWEEFLHDLSNQLGAWNSLIEMQYSLSTWNIVDVFIYRNRCIPFYSKIMTTCLGASTAFAFGFMPQALVSGFIKTFTIGMFLLETSVHVSFHG